MPHQDQLHIGYVPTDWADFRKLLAELGRMTPDEPDYEFVTEDCYSDKPLGTITVEGQTYDVSVQYADWDGDKEDVVVTPDKETGKTWLVIGLQMTSRYRGAILDKQYQHGRPDFFEIDVPRCMLFKEALDIFLKRSTALIWVCHFY